MTTIYCGIAKIPKGSRLGTMRECAEKHQVRYYGKNKIDPKTIQLATDKKVIPETREKLILKLSGLRGTINRNKGRYEGSKDPKAKLEYYKIWKDAEKELIKVSNKIKKL
jgi:hypothetical protein